MYVKAFVVTALTVVGISFSSCKTTYDLPTTAVFRANNTFSESIHSEKQRLDEIKSQLVFQRSDLRKYDSTNTDDHNIKKERSQSVSRFSEPASNSDPENIAVNHRQVDLIHLTTKPDLFIRAERLKVSDVKDRQFDSGETHTTEWTTSEHGLNITRELSLSERPPESPKERWGTEHDKEHFANDGHENEKMDDLKSVLGSDETYHVHDKELKKWDVPPISYYKCGPCKCHNSTSGSAAYANCDKLKLWEFPMELPNNVVYLSLDHNNVSLQFEKLLTYKSLSTLILTSNRIKDIQNITCSSALSVRVLNLSDNKISSISDGGFSCFPNLEKLYLQNNVIQILTNGMFADLSNLQHLDVSSNSLSTIGENAFKRNRHLRFLNLGKNRNMSYSKKKFIVRIFEPLKHLETLYIQGFGKLSDYYPTAVLLTLESLRELKVDGVNVGNFGQNLTSLKNLSTLKIGVDGFCNIKYLNESYFSGLPYLRSVHIEACGPKIISPSVFRDLKLLEELTYSKMSYRLDCLFDSLSGLQNSSLKSLTITNVRKHSKNTACRSLEFQHAKNIKYMSHLTSLNLDNNLISYIDYHFLANLPVSLQKLSIRENTLHYLRSLLRNPAMEFLKNIVEVREDYQNRVLFFDGLSDSSYESEPAVCISQLGTVPSVASAMYSNGIKQAKNSTSTQPLLHSSLRLYSAAQSFNFGERLLTQNKDNPYVSYFNVSNTYMTDWGKKALPSQIEIADFSDNFCGYLSSGFFRVNNSLAELHMGGNFLGDIFASDYKGEILSRLGNVVYIDLSRNHIHDLPQRFFAGLAKVRVINLSSNNLRSFSVSMSHMTSLTFLDLNQNSISTISKQTRDDLDRLNTQHQVSINLTSNLLSCTCAGIDMLQWLATTNLRIISEDFLECETENKKMVPIGDLNERVQALQRICVSRAFLILIISFSIILVLLIALAVWMFRNRWRLYYIKNIAIAKLAGQQNNMKEEGDKYIFDAYILYSKQDVGFVKRECVNELEVKRGHKLCLEHRDFVLGSYMPLTITNAISRCRVTIPVISPDFWKSEWCEYGVQMAVMESIHTKRDVLHLLLYKPVPLKKMPRNLLKVFTENNVSEYPPADCDDDVKKVFWDSVSRIIGHINPRLDDENE